MNRTHGPIMMVEDGQTISDPTHANYELLSREMGCHAPHWLFTNQNVRLQALRNQSVVLVPDAVRPRTMTPLAILESTSQNTLHQTLGKKCARLK